MEHTAAKQVNKIVEAFQYATDEYWGDKSGFKFRVKIDSFDNQQEVGQGTERIIRTTFTMVVNAYLLPEKYNGVCCFKIEFIFGVRFCSSHCSGEICFRDEQTQNNF